MSARRAEAAGAPRHVTIESRQTHLTLSPDSIVFHKHGLEFRSYVPFARWAEMTLTLYSPLDGTRVHCTGVVISCTGNRHQGYHSSLIFTGLTRHAEQRLHTLVSALPW